MSPQAFLFYFKHTHFKNTGGIFETLEKLNKKPEIWWKIESTYEPINFWGTMIQDFHPPEN